MKMNVQKSRNHITSCRIYDLWIFDRIICDHSVPDPQIPVFKTFFKVKNKAMFYLHISTPASRTIESASSSPTMTTSL